jgi:dihydrofolate reductase
MKLELTEFLSLDGVAQGPGSPDEDTSDGFAQGGWFVPHIDETFLQLASDWLSQADALLLGRRTYDNFARDWPTITDPNDRFSQRMNGLPKYVASHTLTTTRWTPTTILSGDIPAQVAERTPFVKRPRAPEHRPRPRNSPGNAVLPIRASIIRNPSPCHTRRVRGVIAMTRGNDRV